jgi:hypothetical protein
VSFLVVDARVDESAARNRVWQQLPKLASETKYAEPPLSLHLSARARGNRIHPSFSREKKNDSPIFSFPSHRTPDRAGAHLDVVSAEWHEILC